jgi:hypothetical protein
MLKFNTEDINQIPIPDKLIKERWYLLYPGDTSMCKCKIHDTLFCSLVEPCWECYNEVQSGDYK